MKRLFKWIRTLLLIALLFGSIWSAGFAWFAYQTSILKPYDVDQSAGAIVVLTGGPGRLDAGLNLFAAYRGRFLFITGVSPVVSEADIRTRWQGKSPLPDCCIALDHQAGSTAQNALMTRQWLDSMRHEELGPAVNSIRLVTSNYHMMRALLDFQRLVPEVTIYPHPVVSSNAGFLDSTYWALLISEYHKYLFRRLQMLLPPPLQEQFA